MTISRKDLDAPALAQAKWDAARDPESPSPETQAGVDPEQLALAAARQAGRQSLEEDDDNPYQESDAALPDDLEEKALSRDPSKEGTRFDEV